MNNITLDSVREIVNTTLGQFQEAVFLLKDIHDGRAGQFEIATFLTKVGVMTTEEEAATKQNEDVMLVGTALGHLNSDYPLEGILERQWASPARTFLAQTITNMPIEYFRTIVHENKNEMWLVSQTLKDWTAWSVQGFGRGQNGPKHTDRPLLMNIVAALLTELRK